MRGAHRRFDAGWRYRAHPVAQTSLFPHLLRRQRCRGVPDCGFYYKNFIRPQRLWQWYDSVVTRLPRGPVLRKRTRHSTTHSSRRSSRGAARPFGARSRRPTPGRRCGLVEESTSWGGLRIEPHGGPVGRVAAEGRTITESRTHQLVVPVRYDENGWTCPKGLRASTTALKAGPETWWSHGLIEAPYFRRKRLPGDVSRSATDHSSRALKRARWAMVMTANGSGDAAIADLERADPVRHVAEPAGKAIAGSGREKGRPRASLRRAADRL